MKDIIKQLQEYQIDAIDKGIEYDLKTCVDANNNLSVKVSMCYTSTASSVEMRTFNTTFSNEKSDKSNKLIMGRIKKFIKDIDNNEEE